MDKNTFFTKEEFAELQTEIDDGYINVNKHPLFPLYIYNYSKSAQYDWYWSKYTTMCRGLILDEDGCLVAKGFDKFFTDDQLKDKGLGDTIPTTEPFEIQDKADGSLGVMYFWEGTHYMATRGSFESEMAIEANKWLRDMYGHICFDYEYTYMFEIIYPENKIVIDYGTERKLVLLAIMDNSTLKELDIYDSEFDYIETQGLERVQRFDGVKDWKQIMSMYDGDNREGFVVHFLESNFRVKMKYEWYKNLAYIMQYFTKRSIWKMIRDGKDMEKILSDIDDEYYDMVKDYVDELWVEYNVLLSKGVHDNTMHDLFVTTIYGRDYTQKDFAVELKEKSTQWDFGLIMALHNNRDPFRQLWQKIEPKASNLN